MYVYISYHVPRYIISCNHLPRLPHCPAKCSLGQITGMGQTISGRVRWVVVSLQLKLDSSPIMALLFGTVTVNLEVATGGSILAFCNLIGVVMMSCMHGSSLAWKNIAVGKNHIDSKPDYNRDLLYICFLHDIYIYIYIHVYRIHTLYIGTNLIAVTASTI